MKKIGQEYMAHVEDAPWFIQAVHQAKQLGKEHPRVRYPLDSFYNDPHLLYSCLWYAYSEGVDVLMVSVVQKKVQAVRLPRHKTG